MSNTSYIWVVMRSGRRFPEAAFTRKHQLVQWLKRQDDPHRHAVLRFPPVYSDLQCTVIPIGELLS